MKTTSILAVLFLLLFTAVTVEAQQRATDADMRIIGRLIDSLEERDSWQPGEIKIDLNHPAITFLFQPGDVPPVILNAWPATDNDFNAPMMQIESDWVDAFVRISEDEYNVLLAIHQRAADADLPVWQPVVGGAPDFSEAAQAQYREWVEETYENPADAATFWDIIGGGCSWYCGGWPESVSASSTLPAQDDFNYTADNAHDLLYDTAWVEGVEGPGIGESLTYRFANDCPRITEIIIHNGYIKSPEAWLNNNRVRSLRLRINGEPTALLALSDVRGEQVFDLETLSLDPLGRRDDGDDLVLTFEIVAVYPGEKYDDTVITEIYFDGIDVH